MLALVVIAAVAAALVYLRFGREGDALSVPNAARAGDLSLDLCEFRAEARSYSADCGTLVVAENVADPGSRLIALPVIRVRATSSDPQEPVFFLAGGPGQSNIDFASQFADRYVAHRDFVVVGYRGADGSVRLDCPEVSSALQHSSDILSEETFRAYADAYVSCASRLTDEGIDVTRYGMVQQVDDMEAARAALGYDRINLLSESAGTRAALIYAWRHPESIHRSFMVGVNPPGAFLWDPDITDEQIGRFAALCAKDVSCRSRTDDLLGELRLTAADLPHRWLFLPIKESNVRVLTLFGLFETAPSGLASAPMMLDAWLSAGEGDTSGFWFASILSDLILSDMFIAGQRAAAASLDFPAARNYFTDRPGDLSNFGRAATASGWAGGRLADSWPMAAEAEAYQRVPSSPVETLVVNGALDVSTPPQLAARDLMPYLPNGHEVVLPDFGHTGSFFGQQPDAGTHLVNTFFDSGVVDVSRYQPQPIDFTPSLRYGAYAKTILALLLGLVGLTVLSLVVLIRWVRLGRGIRPLSAAALRSVYPVVLGLGGWSLGSLVVLTTMPGVRITSALLVVPSVALPIVLGTYCVWLNRGRTARTKKVGLAAAAAGALAGAWLGFHAAPGPLGVVTAVPGAIAGANLMLILVDIAEARSGREHLPIDTMSSTSGPDRESVASAGVGTT